MMVNVTTGSDMKVARTREKSAWIRIAWVVDGSRPWMVGKDRRVDAAARIGSECLRNRTVVVAAASWMSSGSVTRLNKSSGWEGSVRSAETATDCMSMLAVRVMEREQGL